MSKSQEKLPKTNRDKWLPKVRVTEGEFKEAKERAGRADMSFAEFQRRTLLNSTVVIQDNNKTDPETVFQLKAIGNNLNQSTKALHIMLRDFQAHNDFDPARLGRSLDNLDAYLERLDTVLSEIVE